MTPTDRVAPPNKNAEMVKAMLQDAYDDVRTIDSKELGALLTRIDKALAEARQQVVEQIRAGLDGSPRWWATTPIEGYALAEETIDRVLGEAHRGD